MQNILCFKEDANVILRLAEENDLHEADIIYMLLENIEDLRIRYDLKDSATFQVEYIKDGKTEMETYATEAEAESRISRECRIYTEFCKEEGKPYQVREFPNDNGNITTKFRTRNNETVLIWRRLWTPASM